MARPLKVLVTTAHSLRCRVVTPNGEYEVHPSHTFEVTGDHDPESSIHHRYKDFLNRLEEPDNLNLAVCIQLTEEGVPTSLNCYKTTRELGVLQLGVFGIKPHNYSLDLLDDRDLFGNLCRAVDKIKAAIKKQKWD